MIDNRVCSRRQVCRMGLGALAAPVVARCAPVASRPTFRLRYILASCLYGKTGLSEILPEVPKVGAEHIDIWPERHGNQREQIERMGHARFASMLKENGVKLGIFTRYDLGPFRLQAEMRILKKLGGAMIVCGAQGPKPPKGGELKSAVKRFVESMKPQIAAAEELDVRIGIENHSSSLLASPDSQRWLVDFADSKHIGIALAPYHLAQDPQMIGGLIEDLGPRLLHFYAWQHGEGCHRKLPKEQELLQMPGRGPMDFTPIIAALKKINYGGWIEIFMHPVPRGIPILETPTKVTAEINRARAYLQNCVRSV